MTRPASPAGRLPARHVRAGLQRLEQTEPTTAQRDCLAVGSEPLRDLGSATVRLGRAIGHAPVREVGRDLGRNDILRRSMHEQESLGDAAMEHLAAGFRQARVRDFPDLVVGEVVRPTTLLADQAALQQVVQGTDHNGLRVVAAGEEHIERKGSSRGGGERGNSLPGLRHLVEPAEITDWTFCGRARPPRRRLTRPERTISTTNRGFPSVSAWRRLATPGRSARPATAAPSSLVSDSLSGRRSISVNWRESAIAARSLATGWAVDLLWPHGAHHEQPRIRPVRSRKCSHSSVPASHHCRSSSTSTRGFGREKRRGNRLVEATDAASPRFAATGAARQVAGPAAPARASRSR